MNALALVLLLHINPVMAIQLEAFAGCSRVLSLCLGIYMYIFVSIPLAKRLYKWLSPHLGKAVHALTTENILQMKPEMMIYWIN